MAWDDMMTLSALIGAGSYSSCARELGITHATVIRRIRRLEAALGKPIVTREENAFALTNIGHSALAAARQMEKSADRLLRDVEGRDNSVSGIVRIAATEALGCHFLTPRLPSLYAANPGVEVRLELDNQIASLAKRRAHIGVRLARPQEKDMVAKSVGTMRFGLYGSKDLGLAGEAPLCGLHEERPSLPEIIWPQGLGRRFAFQSNNLIAVRESVRAGLGVALLPHYLAVTDTRLKLLYEVPDVEREIWLAYPSEFRDTSRFRPVIDWLAGELSQCP
ncbi:LysR family transcriptional regulator [Halomonas sp. WWR20]